MKIRFLLLLPALLAAGCAHNSPPKPLDKPVHTLGVASNCGSLISRESLAWLNVGADDHTALPIHSWGLDAALPAQLEEATGRRIKTVPVDADLFSVMAWRGERMFGGQTETDMLRAAIRPPAQPVDAYLLYTIGAGSPTNERVNVRYGVGLFSRINLKLAHVQCNARLVDAATFKTMRWVQVNQTQPASDDILLDRWEEYPPQLMEKVRAVLAPLWRKGVDEVVAKTPL